MNKILLGIICGFAFGLLYIMIPLKYEDSRKRIEAMISAFIERFMIGFVIHNLSLGLHPTLVGGLVGAGFSTPTVIMTRVYLPIIGTGVVGGVVIGIIVGFL